MPKRIRTKSRLPAQIENRGLSATLSYFRFDGNYDFTDRTRTHIRQGAKKERRLEEWVAPTRSGHGKGNVFLRYGYESTLCKPNPVWLFHLSRPERKDGFCHVFISITHSLTLSTLETQFNKDGPHAPAASQTNENKACKTLINSKSSKMSKTRSGVWSEKCRETARVVAGVYKSNEIRG